MAPAFEKDECDERLYPVRQSIQDRSFNVLIIGNPSNINLLTGMQAWPDSSAANLVARLWTNDKPGVLFYGTNGGHFQIASSGTIIFGTGNIAQMNQPDEFIEISGLADGLTFFDRPLADMKDPLMWSFGWQKFQQ